MAIRKRWLSLLITSLLTSYSVFAEDNNTNVQFSPDGETTHGYNEQLRKYSESETIIAPITIPAPTVSDRRQRDAEFFNDSAGCSDYRQFSVLTGDDLFRFIANTSSDCISELYRRNDSVSLATYQAENVIDIARRAAVIAADYDSSTGDDLYNLFYYLRGAFYIEYNNEQLKYQDQRPHQALLSLLETYRNNPFISEVTDIQGNTMAEYFTAWDSSKNYIQSVSSITRYLNEFNPEHLTQWSHRSALTKALTTLYRGSWDETYTKSAEQQTALRAALLKVATSEYIYNSEYSYESTDALNEYARFLEYQKYWGLSDSLKQEVNQGIVSFMSHFERNTKAWATAAGALERYNPGECEKFGICGWKEELKDAVLSIHHSCSDTIKIRAQSMTQSELQQSCALLAEEETLFHQILNTNNQPVNDDYNTNLEVNIFDSTEDYKSFAGTIFGISTDNGGMYLEGDPSVEGNQARFIAHEATWRDDILVWNLRHEYIHYLDGRFNMYGSFNYFSIDKDKSVWWSEGLAEYISHQNRYDEAVEIGRQQRYRFSEILNNTYNSGDERVYRWGYLAVRFLFETSPELVEQLMQYARAGDVQGWVNFLNTSIGTSLDYQWYNWLQVVQSDDSPIGGQGPALIPDSCKVQGPYGYGQIYDGNTVCISNGKAYYYFYVDAGVSRIDINTGHGEGNVDLFYSPSSWAESYNYVLSSTEPGNAESLTINNPASGWQYVTALSNPSSNGASLKIEITK
ncbi:collagenase [Photobacterium alginatilyticum]|uniref:collagenase n=1 Tax=Photobacterium alginatilyticum TaxID=1775171 RepID=UPI0040691FFD